MNTVKKKKPTRESKWL